jgi:glycosyltransferase involved in cell wall biosynthesis
MKICIVSHSFFPTIGGAELVVHNLAKHMTLIGEKVVVFTNHKNRDPLFKSIYKVKYYPRTPKKILQGFFFCINLILLQKMNSFDLIHVHVADMGYYVALVNKILKVPIVITTHGRDIQKYPEIGYGYRLDPSLNRKIEFALKNADLVTAIGSSTKKEYLKIGVQEEKIAYIPNGVDLKRFGESYQDIRKILKLRENIKIILTVGRYDKKKGYEYLIKAIPQIIKNNENIKFLFIGKGLDILKPLIRKLSVEKFVIILEQQKFNKTTDSKINFNKIPNDILLSAYKSADIFVSPSLIEGFALVIIEAMASGLPIIATNVSGNEDAVVNEKNGILVPPKSPKDLSSKITRLLENERKIIELGRNSLKLSKQYDWINITNQYLSQYKKILNLDE